MDDLISRRGAIEALNKEIRRRRLFDDDDVDGMLDESDTDEVLKGLPSAQPERKKGKWLPYLEEYHDMFKCSNCGNIIRLPFKCFSPPYYYCPNCGADMKEEEDNG